MVRASINRPGRIPPHDGSAGKCPTLLIPSPHPACLGFRVRVGGRYGDLGGGLAADSFVEPYVDPPRTFSWRN